MTFLLELPTESNWRKHKLVVIAIKALEIKDTITPILYHRGDVLLIPLLLLHAAPTTPEQAEECDDNNVAHAAMCEAFEHLLRLLNEGSTITENQNLEKKLFLIKTPLRYTV